MRVKIAVGVGLMVGLVILIGVVAKESLSSDYELAGLRRSAVSDTVFTNVSPYDGSVYQVEQMAIKGSVAAIASRICSRGEMQGWKRFRLSEADMKAAGVADWIGFRKIGSAPPSTIAVYRTVDGSVDSVVVEETRPLSWVRALLYKLSNRKTKTVAKVR